MEYVLIKVAQCDGSSHVHGHFSKIGQAVWISATKDINYAYRECAGYNKRFICGCIAEVREKT